MRQRCKRKEGRKGCVDPMGEVSDIRREPGSDTVHLEGTVYSLQGGGRTSLNVNGSGWRSDICFTLNATDVHGIAYEIHSDREPSE